MKSKYSFKYFLLSVTTVYFVISNIVVAEEFEATLNWSKRVELSTPINGLIQKVFVQAGEVVAKGGVLVQLDPRKFKADLKFAKAKLKNTFELYQEAKRELERQSDMYDRTMLSEHDLQVAKNNLTTANAEYLQAQAVLTKAKLNLEYSAVRAPFNAVVISKKAVKGQVVASQMTPPVLVVVAEANRMLARFYASASGVTTFVVNQGVKVNVAGKVYQGKISEIALEPDESKSGFYAVDVIFDTKDSILRAGQKVSLSL